MPCAVFCDDVVHAFDEPLPRHHYIFIFVSNFWTSLSAIRTVQQIDFGPEGIV